MIQNDWLAGITWFSWWTLPLSGSTHHELSFWVSWHGRIMVLCWGVLLPLGVLGEQRFAGFVGPQDGDDDRIGFDGKFGGSAHLFAKIDGFSVVP